MPKMAKIGKLCEFVGSVTHFSHKTNPSTNMDELFIVLHKYCAQNQFFVSKQWSYHLVARSPQHLFRVIGRLFISLECHYHIRHVYGAKLFYGVKIQSNRFYDLRNRDIVFSLFLITMPILVFSRQKQSVQIRPVKLGDSHCIHDNISK